MSVKERVYASLPWKKEMLSEKFDNNVSGVVDYLLKKKDYDSFYWCFDILRKVYLNVCDSRRMINLIKSGLQLFESYHENKFNCFISEMEKWQRREISTLELEEDIAVGKFSESARDAIDIRNDQILKKIVNTELDSYFLVKDLVLKDLKKLRNG